MRITKSDTLLFSNKHGIPQLSLVNINSLVIPKDVCVKRWHPPSIENYQLKRRPMRAQSLLGRYLWVLSL